MGASRLPRDSQRIRVYRAHWDYAKESGHLGERSAFRLALSLGVSMSWGKERSTRNMSGGWAQPKDRMIRINPRVGGSTSMATLLHEVAHCLQPEGSAWHGPEFCRVHLDLTERVQGWDKRVALAKALAKHNVKVAARAPMRWSLEKWRWPKAC